MNLLHIDSSILGQNSISRQLSAAVVSHLRASKADLTVTYRDLAASPLSHLSGSYLAGRNADVQHDQALQEDLSLGGSALEEFLAADIAVIGAGMYNFTVSSQLKAWVDRVLVAGKTFRYGPQGAEGLAGDKRVILALARGGHYGPGARNEAAEHLESYLRTIFGFMGITEIETVLAEGLAMGPEEREASLRSGLQAAARLRAA